MSILTEEQAKAILDKVLALSQADECTATLTGSVDGNIRFALNQVSTSGIVSNAQLVVQSAFGKREGITTINSFDDASLERVVRRSEELARLAPENPEYMPAVGKQEFKPSPTFVQATADVTPEQRAQVAAASIGPCKDNKLVAAGFLQDGQSFFAFANSKGNFGYQQATNVDYTCTVRTEDGRGSGWVTRNTGDIRDFSADDAIARVQAMSDAEVAQLADRVDKAPAGAGVVGIAVGFGAQTLVKDIVSGVFFLLLAIIAAIVAVSLLQLEHAGVKVVGLIPQGLPGLMLPTRRRAPGPRALRASR